MGSKILLPIVTLVRATPLIRTHFLKWPVAFTLITTLVHKKQVFFAMGATLSLSKRSRIEWDIVIILSFMCTQYSSFTYITNAVAFFVNTFVINCIVNDSIQLNGSTLLRITYHLITISLIPLLTQIMMFFLIFFIPSLIFFKNSCFVYLLITCTIAVIYAYLTLRIQPSCCAHKVTKGFFFETLRTYLATINSRWDGYFFPVFQRPFVINGPYTNHTPCVKTVSNFAKVIKRFIYQTLRTYTVSICKISGERFFVGRLNHFVLMVFSESFFVYAFSTIIIVWDKCISRLLRVTGGAQTHGQIIRFVVRFKHSFSLLNRLCLETALCYQHRRFCRILVL